ncbi:MAG: NfeD family protein [Pseudomonadota bacterium]
MSYFVWLIFAVIAFVIEMILPTFFALFAGMGFLIAGAVAFFAPEALFWQLIVAAVFMIIGAIVFKNKHIADSNTVGVGTHNEFVGILGKAISNLSPNEEGDVELYESVVSNRHWKALAQDFEIEEGSEIEIVEVRGNTLIVKKHIKG